MPSTICLPMKLDAFVLNQHVADDPEVKIAPITQPNYTFLRLDGQNLQSDILDPVDLHYTHPHENNSRVTDLGNGDLLTKRFGVYLSWILPRAYRTGVAASSASPDAEKRSKAHGINPPSGSDRPTDFDPDNATPNFRAVPTRWLVVRHIDSPDPHVQCRSWIVESDRLWGLDELDPSTDLQLDVSPFVAPSRDNAAGDVEQQAEVFIGRRVDHVSLWKEDDPLDPKRPNRVKPMTLLNASNPLFADFQPHNTNVFSMLDDFTYVDAGGATKVLPACKASYYVIGWHVDPTEDPFYLDPNPSLAMRLGDRLNAIKMSLAGKQEDLKAWLTATSSASTVCHGAIYDVQWTPDASPAPVLGRDAATALTVNGTNVPVSVGTTATDALLTYISAFEQSETDKTVKQLETDIWALRALLLAQDDGVDKQLEATDMLYDYGFDGSDGGGDWHRSGAESGIQPKDSLQMENLKSLFRTQAMLDAATRTLKFLRWQLFSVWWRWVSGAAGDPLDQSIAPKVKAAQVDPLVKRIAALVGTTTSPKENTILGLQSEVLRLSGLLPVKKGSKQPFYTQKDPTLMIGGVQSSWPIDFLDPLAVRLENQLVTKKLVAPSGANWNLFDTPNRNTGLVQTVVAKLPSSIRNAAALLLREFANLQSSAGSGSGGGGGTDPTLGGNEFFPLYHDKGPTSSVLSTDPKTPFRDRWVGQPWFPLLVEWEAQYFHIPFTSWELSSRDAFGSASAHQLLQYRIKPGTDLAGTPNDDTRSAYGRVLLLPQPNFSLKTAITQLLQNMKDTDLKAHGLDPTERATLLRDVDLLPYVSHPLSGLTDHLTTRIQGTHVKPARRPPGGKLSAMPAAVSAGQPIGIGETEILMLDNETDVTPYGRSVGALLPSQSRSGTGSGGAGQHPAFKPVTHGQLRFTKLNVVDKFGQAVCALDPTPTATPPRMSPALADVYVPQPDSKGQPNVVQRDPSIKPPGCEFVQLTPSINQAARLNAVMVVPDGDDASIAKGWRPAYDWEFPGGLWGWVVVNYAEYALQLFLPEGTFYREVRLGGGVKDGKGTTTSPAWTPFQRPDPFKTTSTRQLDELVQQLGDHTYLTAFFYMIIQAQSLLPPAPGSYAQYLNTIVGKPFALVNMAWSLELATPALQNESIKNTFPVDRTLLPPQTPKLPTGLDLSNTTPSSGSSSSNNNRNTEQYFFPLKLGDSNRVYDGMVGYWKAKGDSSMIPTPGPDQGFELGSLYTYWTISDDSTGSASKLTHPPTVHPDTSNYPVLYPFHVSPDAFSDTSSTTPTDTAPISPQTYESSLNAHLTATSAVVDPFTPVHGYTGILPVRTLTVPPWLLEKAMERMTAFFRMGPLVLTRSVPAFQKEYVVTDGDGSTEVGGKTVPGPENAVDVPSVTVGQWEWLQPYDEAVTGPPQGSGGGERQGELIPPLYMGLSVGRVDTKPRFEDAPYRAVDGFLRLTQPIMKPKT